MIPFNFPNPLLEGLPDYKEIRELHEALRYDPLEGVDVESLSIMERYSLLNGEKVLLYPTGKSLMAALTWHGMFRIGLQNRNPMIAANRKRYFELIDPNTLLKTIKAPSAGISVNLLMGPTGTGKSTIVNRFCATLPQVIIHDRNDGALWQQHSQLVYLRADLPHDGSRRGLLENILLSMDEALGTSYAIRLPKQHKGVTNLCLATIRTLISHHTGIIFLDEAQLRNLVQNSQASVMQTFLMEFANSGIPLVFSGNERAFDWLTSSQDITRITITETAHFHPIGVLDEEDWEVEWQLLCDRGIMKFYVLPQPIVDFSGCSQMLYKCSGGIARLALTLWCLAQKKCLSNKLSENCSICPEDIYKIYLGKSFTLSRPLADGFRYKSASTLAEFPDVDVDFYQLHWQGTPPADYQINAAAHLSAPNEQVTQSAHTDRGMSEQAKLKAHQTRQKNKQKRLEQSRVGLSDEDMRKSGHIQHNIDQLAKLRSEVEDK
ncbi:ATP-binding protein [Methylophilus sp. TWE2]|uniref:ATP-binding protein n=1 Tax=Methylophilus sp. TWE2 TaxID=1662285 RepID=UPI000671683F|nr:ATP-binding protein [Methylophilus sp. TWE2]AKR42376.1 hypothetical protein ACJ67_02240 [Methylophilus sp. TWE2]